MTGLILKTISIEELVNRHPVTFKFLSEQGVRCIRCGEPVWGTLEEAALEKGFADDEIDVLVDRLNKLILGEQIKN